MSKLRASSLKNRVCSNPTCTLSSTTSARTAMQFIPSKTIAAIVSEHGTLLKYCKSVVCVFAQELPFQMEVNPASSPPFLVLTTCALESYKGASAPLHCSHSGVLSVMGHVILFYNQGQIFPIKCSTKRSYARRNYNVSDKYGMGASKMCRMINRIKC